MYKKKSIEIGHKDGVWYLRRLKRDEEDVLAISEDMRIQANSALLQALLRVLAGKETKPNPIRVIEKVLPIWAGSSDKILTVKEV